MLKTKLIYLQGWRLAIASLPDLPISVNSLTSAPFLLAFPHCLHSSPPHILSELPLQIYFISFHIWTDIIDFFSLKPVHLIKNYLNNLSKANLDQITPSLQKPTRAPKRLDSCCQGPPHCSSPHTMPTSFIFSMFQPSQLVFSSSHTTSFLIFGPCSQCFF